MRRYVLLCQSVYYAVTGIWPLVNLASFEAVTGPKTDDWLVQTVGALAASIGAALLMGSRRSTPSVETITLAVASAVAFAAVDVAFAVSRTISAVYLVDAVVQGLFLVGLFAGRRT